MKDSYKYSVNRTSKYRNIKVEYGGLKFDSIKERDRFIQLSLLESKGYITDLKTQVPFVLIDKSRYGREIKYIADFTYYMDKQLIVEDVKSNPSKTPLYRIKKRLLAERYGIKITEV